MSRKPTKGYFVRGQFVAIGSELDLELKRELKGSVDHSKTDLKRQSDRLQDLGESLLALNASLRTRLADSQALPEKLLDALAEVRRISDFEGRRRQMQFIGKLMRKLDAGQVTAIEAALEEQRRPSAQATLALHQAEQWRDRLLADDTALAQWLEQAPQTDVQQLRTLIRQARKDALGMHERPGEAQRHGRAYRDIFRTVREALAPDEASANAGVNAPQPATDAPP